MLGGIKRLGSARSLLIAIVFLAAVCTPAHAHKPVAVGTLESSADSPIALFDINVSQVLYYEPTAGRPAIWMGFHGEAGQELFVQPGVPQIPGLEGVRPAYALLSTAIPDEVSLPFDVPKGYGGRVFGTEGTAPEPFDEPFTGTKDWQFPANRISLPATGNYLLVAYLPDSGLDKFWIAVGEEEAFTLADILNLPRITVQVRAFHEIGPIGGIGILAPLIALFALIATFFAKCFVV